MSESNQTTSPYLAHFYRYTWDAHELLIVLGEADSILRGAQAYRAAHGIEEPEDDEQRRGLARLFSAAALAAVSLPRRESWGWTVTPGGLPHGFFCAVEPEGRVCGTLRDAPATKRAAVLQRQRAGGPLMQSAVELLSTDPADAIASYFERVVQVPTRVVPAERGRVALVQRLPGGSLAPIEGLDDAALIARLEELAASEELTLAEEVLIFYDCRCDDEMILSMLTSLPESHRKEVWGDSSQIEVQCPRCERRYRITRA